MTATLTPLGAGPKQVLALISRARDDLARVEDPREAASFVKRADAIKYLAQKAEASQEVQDQAVERQAAVHEVDVIHKADCVIADEAYRNAMHAAYLEATQEQPQ